jgi:glc operon protein GlcG
MAPGWKQVVREVGNFVETVVRHVPLKLLDTQAVTIISGCIAAAVSINHCVMIVVATPAGQVKASLAMEGYTLSSTEARNKAITAAIFRSRMVPDAYAKQFQHWNGSKYDTVVGGVPIWWGNTCVGAVGVVGGQEDVNTFIATAGIQSTGLTVGV